MIHSLLAAIVATLLLLSCGRSSAKDLHTGPDWWLQKIAGSSIPIHSGTCDGVRCMIFADALSGHGWLLLFTAPDNAPTVIFQVFTDERPAAVVWCRRDYCPKGVI